MTDRFKQEVVRDPRKNGAAAPRRATKRAVRSAQQAEQILGPIQEKHPRGGRLRRKGVRHSRGSPVGCRSNGRTQSEPAEPQSVIGPEVRTRRGPAQLPRKASEERTQTQPLTPDLPRGLAGKRRLYARDGCITIQAGFNN